MGLFSRKNNVNKKIYLYAVYKTTDRDRFLTITVTKDEAEEYIIALLKNNNLNHYNSWCELQGLNPCCFESWRIYFDTCITDEEKSEYLICRICYALKDLIAMIRMFGGCEPIGCSFESPAEFEYVKTKFILADAAEALKNDLERLSSDEVDNGK